MVTATRWIKEMKYVALIIIVMSLWGCAQPDSSAVVSPQAIHLAVEQWLTDKGLSEVSCGYNLARDQRGIRLLGLEVYRLQDPAQQDDFLTFLRSLKAIPQDCNPTICFYERRDTFSTGDLSVSSNGTVQAEGADWKQSSSRSLLREQTLRTE